MTKEKQQSRPDPDLPILEDIVSTDVEKLFQAVFESRGPNTIDSGIYVRDPAYPASPQHNALNHWKWVSPGMKEPGSAAILMSFGTNSEQLLEKLSNPSSGMFIIHELMHVAIRGNDYMGNDFDFANAVADLAGVDHQDFSGDVANASSYWDESLRQKCGWHSKKGNFVREP